MSKVIDRDKGYAAFIAGIAVAGAARRVVVGFLEGTGQKSSGERGEATVAEYAAYNEFGTNTIPARPFMSTTIDENRSRYAKLAQSYMEKALLGGARDPVMATLKRLGNDVRNDLIQAIVAWDDPPNAESTVEQKGANNPLVDTGHMSRAIIWEIRAVGSE